MVEWGIEASVGEVSNEMCRISEGEDVFEREDVCGFVVL